MARTCHHPQQCHPQQRLCAVRCCAAKANLICRKSNINQKISKINLLTKTHHVKANWWIDSDVIHFVTISLHFFFCTTIILYPKEWQISASIARLSQYIGQYIFAIQKKRKKWERNCGMFRSGCKPIKQEHFCLQFHARPV